MEELFMRWWFGSKYMQVVRMWRQEQTARDAWNAGVAAEREACAKVCDNRAEMCAAKLETTDDQDDRTELKANAWQFSVLAAEIRKRSNAEVTGRPPHGTE